MSRTVRTPYVPPTLRNGYEYSNSVVEGSFVSDESISDPAEAVKRPTCRNSLCAVLFILQLVSFILASSFYVHEFQFISNDPRWPLDLPATFFFYGLTAVVSSIVAAVFACSWLLLAVRYRFVVISCIAAIMGYAGVLIWEVAYSDYSSVISYSIIIFLILRFLIQNHKRGNIAFTEALIEVAFKSITQYWGVFIVALIAIMAVVVSSVYYFVAMLAMHVVMTKDTALDTDTEIALWVGFTVSILWLLQVLMNASFVTTSGSVGVWYYNILEAWDAASSLRRATSTSLGSVALASLLIGPASILRSLTCYSPPPQRQVDAERSAAKQPLSASDAGSDGGQPVQSPGWRCQHPGALLSRYCNRLALTHIALHGTPFFSASTSAYDVARGNRGMVDANVTDGAVMAVAMLGGLLAKLAARLVHRITAQDEGDYSSMLLTLAFVVGYFASQIVFTLLSAAVGATLVVYMQDSDTIASNRPDAFYLITRARAVRFGGDGAQKDESDLNLLDHEFP